MKRSLIVVLGITLLTLSFTAIGCGEGGGASTSVPATPDGAIKAVADSLVKNQPRAAWDAMPVKWQGDVNGLVHEFAGKIDAEMYNKTFAVAGKLADVLAKQKKLVLQLADDPQMGPNLPVSKADLEARYDTIVSFVGTVAKSDAATIDGLKTLDIGKFLGTTGAKLMADMDRIAELHPAGENNDYTENKAKLANTKVEIISSTDTTATVKVTSGDEVRQEQMTKVDGKWVPTQMANEWDAKIAQAKANLAEMTGAEMAKNKPQVLAMLNSVDAGLTTIGKAETAEELKQAAMGVAGSIMQQMMGGGGGIPGPDDMQ